MMAAEPERASGDSTAREWPWARLTGLAGLAFVALSVAGFVIAGEDPTPGAPLEDVRAYFVDNRSSVLAAVYLDGLALACFLGFAAGLGGLVAGGGGDRRGILARLMLAGAVGMATITLVEDMTEAALAYRTAAQGEPGAVQALFDLYMMVPIVAFPLAVFLAAAAAGILRSGVAPGWLGWAAFVPALLLLVGAAGLDDPRGPVAAIGFVGGYLPFLLWTLVLSGALLVRRGGEARAGREQAVASGGRRRQAGA